MHPCILQQSLKPYRLKSEGITSKGEFYILLHACMIRLTHTGIMCLIHIYLPLDGFLLLSVPLLLLSVYFMPDCPWMNLILTMRELSSLSQYMRLYAGFYFRYNEAEKVAHTKLIKMVPRFSRLLTDMANQSDHLARFVNLVCLNTIYAC